MIVWNSLPPRLSILILGNIEAYHVHWLSGFLHVSAIQLVIMADVRRRCGHYILQLWFLSSFFFHRLISAVADWMSTILRHMMWP